jgi:hypothetical protein
VVPVLKLPSGHAVPELVTDCTALHFVRSFASWVNPCLQVTQMPLPSAHCWQPSWHTAQLPFPSRKNPGAQVAHRVLFDAVVQPALHVHWPLVPQTPLRQLQAEEALAPVVERQRPEPAIPSSQVAQPAGHAWHEGPKKPFAHTSQDVPLKPG